MEEFAAGHRYRNYSDANDSPATRLRCDLLLRLACQSRAIGSASRACAAWKPPFPCFTHEDAGHNPLHAVVGIQLPAVSPCFSSPWRPGQLDCLRPSLLGVFCIFFLGLPPIKGSCGTTTAWCLSRQNEIRPEFAS